MIDKDMITSILTKHAYHADRYGMRFIRSHLEKAVTEILEKINENHP